jgi:chromosome segregation ATPase
MLKNKPNYKLGENIYKSIDKVTNSSKEILTSSTNLITLLSNLFESIEDDVTSEILIEAGKINDFISLISSFTKHELQEIQIKSKIAIDKADKRKMKINKLKEDNKKFEEKINDCENEKQKLTTEINRLSNQLNDLYHMNKIYEEKSKMELINQKNEKMLKEKYINQINIMQKEIDDLKSKNKAFMSTMERYKRQSTVLEEKNRKLSGELGSKTMQFITKMKERTEQEDLINSLRLQNDELSKKIKYLDTENENLRNMCKLLEDKIEKHDNLYFTRKNRKKLSTIRNVDGYANLNDLLGFDSNESDVSDKENIPEEKKSNKIIEGEEIIKQPKKNEDIVSLFETDFNTYENFFL